MRCVSGCLDQETRALHRAPTAAHFRLCCLQKKADVALLPALQLPNIPPESSLAREPFTLLGYMANADGAVAVRSVTTRAALRCGGGGCRMLQCARLPCPPQMRLLSSGFVGQMLQPALNRIPDSIADTPPQSLCALPARCMRQPTYLLLSPDARCTVMLSHLPCRLTCSKERHLHCTPGGSAGQALHRDCSWLQHCSGPSSTAFRQRGCRGAAGQQRGSRGARCACAWQLRLPPAAADPRHTALWLRLAPPGLGEWGCQRQAGQQCPCRQVL